MSDYEKLLNLLLMFFYDADSSLGTDNKGNLAFDYYLEDIDYTDAGEPVYNGQNSVLWKNLRAAFYDEIAAEYKRLRTTIREDGTGRPLISYDVVNDKFENHQSIWSEAIYNEDGYRKCIEPLVLNGDTTYLSMLQGKKEQHRKWWLYNRFRYMDSKYVTGSSMDTRILIRAHAKGNVTLTSYVNMYGHVYYNAEMVEHRMFRGVPYEFEWAASGAEDTVIGINDADMLTSLGDLSQNMVETIDISAATHLTFLKLGDASESYSNANLNTLTLGNNTLLRSIDVRNCVSLAQAVDASGCTGLEEAYFDNTAITGLTLPNGAGIKVLHLPSTITNLTLRNCTALTEFVLPSYGNITTLRLENNSDVVDPLAILSDMPVNSRVRIIGFSAEFDTADEIKAVLDKLDTMRGLDEGGNNVDKPQVSGTAYIPSLTSKELYEIQQRYPDITVVYVNLVTYTVRFYNGSTLLQTAENAMYSAYVEYTGDTPIKSGETDDSRWRFAGWNPDPSFVTGDMDCYAVYVFNGLLSRELVMRTIEGEYVNHRVTQIGEKVFRYCASLTRADFLNVETVFDNAFAFCTALSALILRGETLCVLKNTFAFQGSSIQKGTGYIYVPRALLSDTDATKDYRRATNWSTFAAQFRAIEDFSVDGTVTGELDETKI